MRASKQSKSKKERTGGEEGVGGEEVGGVVCDEERWDDGERRGRRGGEQGEVCDEERW